MITTWAKLSHFILLTFTMFSHSLLEFVMLIANSSDVLSGQMNVMCEVTVL